MATAAAVRGVAPPRADSARPVVTEQLTKRYGDQLAVQDVCLEIHAGEVFGYLGPNGAGKTTTIRLLMGLLRPTAGRARVFGLDAWREGPAIHARVGYVPGDAVLYERMTGRELLTYLSALRRRDDLAYAGELAERLDVELHRPIRALSKGNRQKLVLVQALMSRPELLVLDEPTTGLDPLVQQTVHDLLREHVDAGGTVLLSSHVLSEVQSTADRVGIIREGRLVSVERLDDLRRKSLHHIELTFAGAVPGDDVASIPGVRDVTVLGGTLTCSAPQVALDAIVKVAAGHTLVDLSCEEASLEDTFLAYYSAAGPPDAT